MVFERRLIKAEDIRERRKSSYRVEWERETKKKVRIRYRKKTKRGTKHRGKMGSRDRLEQAGESFAKLLGLVFRRKLDERILREVLVISIVVVRRGRRGDDTRKSLASSKQRSAMSRSNEEKRELT